MFGPNEELVHHSPKYPLKLKLPLSPRRPPGSPLKLLSFVAPVLGKIQVLVDFNSPPSTVPRYPSKLAHLITCLDYFQGTSIHNLLERANHLDKAPYRLLL